MRPPLAEFFAPPRRNRRLWIAATLSVVFLFAQLPAAQTMSDRGAGIIPFEVARTEAEAAQILADWGSEGRHAASASLVLDFGYLVGYGLLLAGLNGLWSGRARAAGRRRLADVAALAAWAGLLAAGFDALENLCLLVVAADHPAQPFPALAFLFACAKFGLATFSTLMALAGWPLTRGAPTAPGPA